MMLVVLLGQARTEVDGELDTGLGQQRNTLSLVLPLNALVTLDKRLKSSPASVFHQLNRKDVSSCLLLASCVCFILLWEREGMFNSLPVYPIFILFNLLLVLILTSAALSQSGPQCS